MKYTHHAPTNTDHTILIFMGTKLRRARCQKGRLLDQSLSGSPYVQTGTLLIPSDPAS